MIPAHGYEAVYEVAAKRADGSSGTVFEREPVAAWDAEGRPLIVGRTGLTLATNHAGFVRVQPSADPVIAAVPGGGWVAEWREDDGSLYSSPVVAWAIQADGSCEPISSDPLGSCDNPTESSNFVRLYHPEHPLTTTE